VVNLRQRYAGDQHLSGKGDSAVPPGSEEKKRIRGMEGTGIFRSMTPFYQFQGGGGVQASSQDQRGGKDPGYEKQEEEEKERKGF